MGFKINMEEEHAIQFTDTTFIEKALRNKEFEWLIDALPFGISIQTKDRIVLYENKAVKELLGNFKGNYCYRRWKYLPDGGKEPCKDCPVFLAFEDKTQHSIFRKTEDRNGDPLFLEVSMVPILNKANELEYYIEIIKTVDLKDKKTILATERINDIVNKLKFSLVKFGESGADVIYKDKLNIEGVKDEELFVIKLTVYVFSAFVQGNRNSAGFYGPLPVMDKEKYLMFGYSFIIRDKKAKDPRKKGYEQSILFFILPRKYYFILSNRRLFEAFISQNLSSFTLLDQITLDVYETLKEDIRQYIVKNLDVLM